VSEFLTATEVFKKTGPLQQVRLPSSDGCVVDGGMTSERADGSALSLVELWLSPRLTVERPAVAAALQTVTADVVEQLLCFHSSAGEVERLLQLGSS
jgi:hypothetical protein